ncbi:hypothetical protein BCR43DRAFT_350160 [Syncephalastrum racemosum]|uniref:LSM domain-containing protein n=1 Tax=Syncephalastrum racemosum TaxID=13706 RepID=A0A1X2H6B8_SYNRA|nr:hypothetical protein BCR43DRAFT_350160 [Syncephalastrum racemosum]
MSEYTGTRLKVELTDGTLLQGVVCSIDQHTSVLHLKEVVIRLPDGNLRGAPELKVQGTQIKDLSVVEAAAPKQNEPSPAKPMPEQRKQQQLQQQQQPQQSQPSRQPTQAERKPEPSGFVDPAIVSMSAQSSPAPQSAAPVTTKQQQQQQQQQPKPNIRFNHVR